MMEVKISVGKVRNRHVSRTPRDVYYTRHVGLSTAFRSSSTAWVHTKFQIGAFITRPAQPSWALPAIP